MSRPDFVTNEDLARWSENIDNDPLVDTVLVQSPIIREVCYSGLWLCEKLEELLCPRELIGRIQFTGGRLSFGRDPWLVHQELLQLYIDGELNFELNSEKTN